MAEELRLKEASSTPSASSNLSGGFTRRSDDQPKGKTRTVSKLKSLSAVAFKLNKALETPSEVSPSGDRGETVNDARHPADVLAGTVVMILWKNAESLVNPYQENWIEKVGLLEVLE